MSPTFMVSMVKPQWVPALPPEARTLRGAALGKRVVLVDDVMTSGASLHTAAQVLRQAGAAHISAVVLARTTRQGLMGKRSGAVLAEPPMLLANAVTLPSVLRASPSVMPTAAMGGWLNTTVGTRS